MTTIKELKPQMGNVNIEVEVVSVSEPREFNKYGRMGKVATAKVKDSTGQIDLSLWNDQCEEVKAGDKIKIANGYVSEWQNNLQLTAGKFGTLTIVKGE
jgi:replication factor A1